MTELVAPAPAATVAPWAPVPGETPEEFLRFVAWMFLGGEIAPCAERNRWTQRRNVLEALASPDVASIPERLGTAAEQHAEIVIRVAREKYLQALADPEGEAKLWTHDQVREALQFFAGLRMPEQRSDFPWAELTPAERQTIVDYGALCEKYGL